MDRLILRRLASELLFDLAHLGEADDIAHAGRVDPVFGRQVDADTNEGRADHSGDGRAPQLLRCGQERRIGLLRG